MSSGEEDNAAGVQAQVAQMLGPINKKLKKVTGSVEKLEASIKEKKSDLKQVQGEIDKERNLVFLRGAVPGHVNGYLMINRTVKNERDLTDKPGMQVSNAAAKAMIAKSK